MRDEGEQLREALYDRSRPSPTLVTLRRGGPGRPIFLAPGVGNDMRDLYPLARLLPVQTTIYGLQPRGSNGLEEPQQTVTAFAETHLADIRRAQPHGPYLLIGYSLGGLVMLEIARRLRERGEEIALLAMLDSYPCRKWLPRSQLWPLVLRLARRKMLRMIGYGDRKASVSHVMDSSDPVEQALARVEAGQDAAWYSYRPAVYAGRVRYVDTAEKMDYFPRNARAVWAPWIGEFTLETVPGNHGEMLHREAPKVAEILCRYLSEPQG